MERPHPHVGDGDTYGDRILSIYEHMLAWLMDRADL